MNPRATLSTAATIFVAAALVVGADDKTQGPNPPPSPSPAAAASPSPSKPSLAGRFKFNPDKSDDARAKIREAMAQRRQASGGGGGGGFGGGGMGHRGFGGGGGGGYGGGGYGGGRRGGNGQDGSQSDPQRSGTRALMQEATDPGSVLTITHSDPELTITYDDGRVLTLYTDGRKVKPDDGGPERQTKWEASRVVSDVKASKGGAKLKEAYSIDPQTAGLDIILRFELPYLDDPVIIHQHYDAAPLDAPQDPGVTVTP